MQARSKIHTFTSLSILIFGLLPGAASVTAESPIEGATIVALLQQQGQLDQQISLVEKRIFEARGRPSPLKVSHKGVARSVDRSHVEPIGDKNDRYFYAR